MKVRSFLLVLSSILLAGCVAVVVAGAAAGLVVYDKRSLSMLESDTRIFHVIHKAVVSDPRFSGSRILVSSFNRVVLLVGQTPTASLRVLIGKNCAKHPLCY